MKLNILPFNHRLDICINADKIFILDYLLSNLDNKLVY